MTREMKESGVKWIGTIPKDWQVKKVKHVFERKNEKAQQNNPIVLSLARSGVRVRDISNNEGQLAESYYNYNPVIKNDLLLNPMDLYSGANCSVSQVEGVISPAYINLRAKGNNNSSYYDYYFKTQYWSMAFFAHGKGVSFDNRWTLSNETAMNYLIPLPSIEEQNRITNYLNGKISEIDSIIIKTKESVEEYKKYKKSIIRETVTKGLNKTADMKDSGIKWIGIIPSHWKSIKIKRLVRLYNGKEIVKEVEKSDTSYNVYGSGGVFKYTDDYLYNGEAVLFGRKGSIGKPIYVVDKFWTVDTMYYSVCNNKLSNKLFYYILTIFPWDKYTTKTALPSIVGSEVFNCRVAISMDMKEQQQIVEFLDKKCTEIDNLIEKKEELVRELESYKKSLIYECVTGKKEI